MKLGARTLKTGLAIFLSIIIPTMLGYPELATLSAISVISSMQPSVKRSLVAVSDRVLANTIGGLVAFIFAYYFGVQPIMIGFASAFLIAVLNYLNLNSVIGLSIMTLITIMLTPTDALIMTAITRVLATILGVLIAFLVNSFIFPPQFDKRLFDLTNEVSDELMRYIRISLRKNMKFATMRQDLKAVEKKIETMELFLGYIQEGEIISYLKRRGPRLSRLIVVYRQFIRTTWAAYELNVALNSSENIYNNLPEDFRLILRERIEVLMTGHEQILEKWNGRILPENVNFIDISVNLKEQILNSFFKEASLNGAQDEKGPYNETNTTIKFMSKMLAYEESLIQLNQMVTVYLKFHIDD